MPTRTFDSLVPRVQASVPGCPYATIVQYIRDAAIRTCERTLYWRYQPSVFNLSPGVHEYVYNKPVDTDVHAVFEVFVNNRPLRRLTLEDAIEAFPQWNDFSTSGTPQVITQISPDKYIVLPVPDNGHVYQCRMFLALKPKHDALGMDSAVFDDLEEVIMHGALQHLLALPSQPWSDRELAAYHAKQYVFQIAERRARANLGSVRGTIRVKARPFGV